MYYCPDCGYEFETPEKTYETHRLDCPPYEELLICPECKSSSFYEKSSTHCRCCGARLNEDAKEYCSATCRNKGEKLWLLQQQKRKSDADSPLGKIIREIESYNKHHGTDYSYGQYVTLVKSKRRSAKKCIRKKRNT